MTNTITNYDEIQDIRLKEYLNSKEYQNIKLECDISDTLAKEIYLAGVKNTEITLQEKFRNTIASIYVFLDTMKMYFMDDHSKSLHDSIVNSKPWDHVYNSINKFLGLHY